MVPLLYSRWVKSKTRYLVGVDEAGEKVWETFARPCEVDYDRREVIYPHGVLFL